MEHKHPPALIKLSLPTALLSSLSKESRLTIREGDGDEKRSVTVSFANTKSPVEHKLQRDEAPTNWYQRTSSSNSGMIKLNKVGTTKHQYNINTKPKLDTSTSNLKRIGAQTRKLLDEERRKRKEIVRLENDVAPLPPEILHKEAPPTIKRDGPTNDTQKKTKTKKHRVKRKRNDPTIDPYMPNVEHLIANAIGKEDRSNILRLHGLPVGVRRDDIRKLFHGLDPTVFVLPSFNGHIEGWDALDSDAKKNVMRHPETFRVYAKFQSVLVADAAIERVGESIGFDVQLNGCDGGMTGAAISLSPVSRHVASFLLKHLVSIALWVLIFFVNFRL
jgi:hypothetical protein